MAEWPKCYGLPLYTFITWKTIINYQHSGAVSAKITCRPNFEIRTKTNNIYFESFILHSIFTRLGMAAKGLVITENTLYNELSLLRTLSL